MRLQVLAGVFEIVRLVCLPSVSPSLHVFPLTTNQRYKSAKRDAIRHGWIDDR
jgi:hypothetical protein